MAPEQARSNENIQYLKLHKQDLLGVDSKELYRQPFMSDKKDTAVPAYIDA